MGRIPRGMVQSPVTAVADSRPTVLLLFIVHSLHRDIESEHWKSPGQLELWRRQHRQS